MSATLTLIPMVLEAVRLGSATALNRIGSVLDPSGDTPIRSDTTEGDPPQ